MFEQYAEAANRNRIIGDLLKFSKGDWLAGRNADVVPMGTRLIANMDDLMVGWVRWSDNKPGDSHLGRVLEAYQPPKRQDLGDLDEAEWDVDVATGKPKDPWQFSNVLVLKEQDGEQLYTFNASSKGAIGSVAALCGSYGKMMRQRPDEFPLVELGFDSYRHSNKAYGIIKTPVFKVAGWAPKSGVVAAMIGEAANAEADREAEADTAAHAEAVKTGGKAPAEKKTASGATRF